MKYRSKKSGQVFEVVKIDAEVVTLKDDSGKEKEIKLSTLHRSYEVVEEEVEEETKEEKGAVKTEVDRKKELYEEGFEGAYTSAMKGDRDAVLKEVEYVAAAMPADFDLSRMPRKELQRYGNNTALTTKENVDRMIKVVHQIQTVNVSPYRDKLIALARGYYDKAVHYCAYRNAYRSAFRSRKKEG